MNENYPATIENILQERNQSQGYETLEDCSSRTCTSTNTSKSENNEQNSFKTPIKDEICSCLQTTDNVNAGCTILSASSMKPTCMTSETKRLIRKDEKAVNHLLNDTMSLLEDNSSSLLSYKHADSSQRPQNLAALQMSAHVLKMKSCETCGGLHNGSFASGRFCSSKCARTVGGIARKMQRLRSKSKENNARTVSKDKHGTAAKFLQKVWTSVQLDNSRIAPRRDYRTYSDWTWITDRHQMENDFFRDHQHFQIASSLCSLDNADRIEKNEQVIKNSNDKVSFQQEGNTIERLKGQHTKMDVASLLN
ncbi:hypothetical protein GpartN1_g917.t1 [Galdieria partita]|uniref:Uncharacterized protein n=1 Tax=Galdieria partita TaxID=83374 RepID=A0A9C7PRL0_9RHOD|nr:hypothetical protein GpartN1_g917.t1 [Galdieria partita]